MKTLYTILAASTSLVGAQVIVNNGTFTCPGTGAYCAGDSMKTNIIIRCDGTHGQPGNCYDNLSGYPPQGGNALCYQTSPTAGDAACEKNCIVHYGAKSITLPPDVCKPSYTETSTSCSETSTSTSTTSSEPPCTTTTSTTSEPPCTTSTTTTPEPPCTTTTSTTAPPPTSEPPCTNSTTTTKPVYPTNSTTITYTQTFTTSTATNTPVKPTTSVPPVTAAAATAGMGLGALGAALLWLL